MKKDISKISVKKPHWLRKRLPKGPEYERVRALLSKSSLNTVCQEAKCPNIFECFSKGTATFLIMGNRCTRNCLFCAIAHGPKGPPDPDEPQRLAYSASVMKLDYIVVTSVTRDDLPDGGASVFSLTIEKIRQFIPSGHVEVLIPDFQGDTGALKQVVEAGPDVLNHNIETVPRLYAGIRRGADFKRSIGILKNTRKISPAMYTKSGLMLGLGEKKDEVIEVFRRLVDAGCSILTLGQYLQPSSAHYPVSRFLPPEEFDEYKKTALHMGFKQVESGPFVRSSFNAGALYCNMANVIKED